MKPPPKSATPPKNTSANKPGSAAAPEVEPEAPKSKRKLWVVLGVGAAVVALLAWAIWYFGFVLPGRNQKVAPTGQTAQTPPSSVPYAVSEVVGGLDVPWSIAFAGQNRMLVTERPGRIRIIQDGKLLPQPLAAFPEVSSESEEGLMGMTTDPAYDSNHLVYVCMAYNDGNKLSGKVVRFEDKGSSIVAATTLVDKIPAAHLHAGCKVKFGSDGKLYISTGDATNTALPQNLSSLAGKILRINSDGSVPADNPFVGSPVWSYGHRNPQGLCWQPGTGQMYAVEHGPSGSDGPEGGDELNVINKGANYGWPLVSHQNKKEGTVAPVLVFTPAVAPSACAFYDSAALPQLRGNLFFAALRGTGLWRVQFDPNNPSQITSYAKMTDINFGRLREVIAGPDGALYFTTSNRDGRGDPRPGDDKIYKIAPAQ